jgi:protein TonB
MVLPRLLSSPPITYTREALEAQVTGSAIIRCVITKEGEVRRCRAIKSVPLMTEAVIASLEARRYTPVLFRGQAVSVTYVFNVRLELP